MKKLIYLFIALTAGVTLYSCHSKDDPEPATEAYSFRLSVQNAKGDDISASGEVSEATLYIFDEDGTYLKSMSVTANQIKNKEVITLSEYPSTQKLNIVTWGGLAGNNQEAPTLVAGTSTLNDLNVMLREVKQGIANSPDRLYHGAKTTVARAASTVQDITVAPKIARLQVIVIGLDQFKNRAAGEDASLLIDRTKSGFDYNGEQIGSEVSYVPTLGDGEDGNQVTPVTNMLPTDELGVQLSVMDKVFNVNTDDDGNPLHAVNDSTVVVVMRVAPDDNSVKLISVKTEVVDWNEVVEYPIVEPDENL